MLLRRISLVVSLLLLAAQPSHVAATLELLQNGGFEGGTSGWSGAGLSASGCPPRGDSGTLALVSSGSTAFAQQTVSGPLADGSYALSGWLNVQSGSPQVEINLIWLDDGGSELERRSKPIDAGGSYGRFSLSSSRPPGAASLRVRLSSYAAGVSSVCLDDVSLDGPPRPSPTLTPTAASPTPSLTPTSAPLADTPRPSSTPKPTSTAKPTATTRPAPTAPVEPTLPAQPQPSPTEATEPSTAHDDHGSDAPASLKPSAAGSIDPTATGSSSSESVTPPVPVQEVRSVDENATSTAEAPPHSLTRPPSDDAAVPTAGLFGAALFAFGLGGNYVFHRHRD